MRRAWIAGAVIAAVLAGCGGESEEQSARAAAETYVDAQNRQDFEEVCRVLSGRLRQQLGGENCPRFIDEQTSGAPRHEFRLISVDENGDRAIAELQTQGETGAPVRLRLSLERQDGNWRVAELGSGGGD